MKLPWQCSIPDCQNPKLGSLDICASHAKIQRDEEREASKPVKPVKRMQRSGPVKKVSEKRKEQSKEYSVLRKEYLDEHPNCEANLINCTGKATEVHHRAKRGKNYLNKETFMAVCSECHLIIEQAMSAADRREQGFLMDVKEKPTI